MPSLPDWVIPILREFPVLVTVFVAIGIVVQYTRRSHAKEIGRLERRIEAETANHEREIADNERKHNAEIARLIAEHDKHVRSKDSEIRWLRRQFAGHKRQQRREE